MQQYEFKICIDNLASYRVGFALLLRNCALQLIIETFFSFAGSLHYSDLRISCLKEAMEKSSQKNHVIFNIFNQINGVRKIIKGFGITKN